MVKRLINIEIFYIITDLIGRTNYMTWEQVDKLYQAGNEIGSHSLFGGDLINTKWFEKKFNKTFNHTDLVKQIKNSKQKLDQRGYDVKTFAYPLGSWNRNVVQIVKENGYIAARDTNRDLFVDRRNPTIFLNNNDIWHMHYYKTELESLKQLKK